MIFEAVLQNDYHPEYGTVTIPFPIERRDFVESMGLLKSIKIGDPIATDCRVVALNGGYPVLKRLESFMVNVDELDYLAKRLDSFCEDENMKFSAIAHKLEIFQVKDFINLTFCCQQATVISDFTNLGRVGKDHYITINGGSAPVSDLEKISGEKIAKNLIENSEGEITPYGVVYDNGMVVEEIFHGGNFPRYHYEANLLTMQLTSESKPNEAAYLYLPCEREQIERTIQRANFFAADTRMHFCDSLLPDAVNAALDFEREDILNLNKMANAIAGYSQRGFDVITSVVKLTKANSAAEIIKISENIEAFNLVPDVGNCEELGRYMICESGHFDYDAELDDYYDFAKYGEKMLAREHGMFTEQGYVAYFGEQPLDDFLGREQKQELEMNMEEL